MEVRSCILGPYTGMIVPSFDTPELRNWLEDALLKGRGEANGRPGGRHGIRVVVPDAFEQGRPIVVKSFARQFFLKDRLDVIRRSKAHRSFLAGCRLHERGIGTPMPVAYLDRWENRRLSESYLVTEYEPDMTDFRGELIHLYRHEPECEKLMSLLRCVAQAVRGMHDAGLFHRDLGNQNILLRRESSHEWGDVMFIDLNRSRIRESVSLRERAFDLSRITLPSDFLRVFKAMYFGDHIPPRGLDIWEGYYRKRFAFHTWSRTYRHPLRTKQWSRRKHAEPAYPDLKDIWIWDERSAQAIVVMRSHERRKHYPAANAVRITAASLSAFPCVYKRYRTLMKSVYGEPVCLSGRVGLALHGSASTWKQERVWLERLGRLPVLLRFYHHQDRAQWDYTAQCIRALHADGYPVSVALVQDPRAVREPEKWDAFVRYVLEHVSGCVEWVEIGHAINRVKWGVWSLEEYRRLLRPFSELPERNSSRFMGPAVIDFEYHYLIGALRQLKGVFKYDALSHHLYVDRRGAPECAQSGFSTLEKCALARAIADWAPSTESKLIVSEVNWPIEGTGEYSPVGAPYITPGPRTDDPSVNEDTYADYMIRYLVITLASGLVEQVYWWRLAAHGFGLIDDREPESWRSRPAFHALKQFMEALGDSTFIEGIPAPEGAHVFLFRRPDGEEIALAYAHPGSCEYVPAFSYEGARDILGDTVSSGAGPVRLTGRPVYFQGVQRGA